MKKIQVRPSGDQSVLTDTITHLSPAIFSPKTQVVIERHIKMLQKFFYCKCSSKYMHTTLYYQESFVLEALLVTKWAMTQMSHFHFGSRDLEEVVNFAEILS